MNSVLAGYVLLAVSIHMKCDKCHKQFKGKHRCWCKECNKPHPICDKCYKQAKKDGTIIDKETRIWDISNWNRFI